MSLEWFCSAVVAAVGSMLLGHFGEGVPKSRRLSKWAVFWILGLPATGAVFHVRWCRRHGIDPLTAETRDEYYWLRGWGPQSVRKRERGGQDVAGRSAGGRREVVREKVKAGFGR